MGGPTDKAFEFQEQILSGLAELSYYELEALKGRIDIEAPDGLAEFSFAREVTDDEFGGLEVAVFHYYFPNDEELAITKSILGDMAKDVTLGECQMRLWFNISADGSIEWPDMEFHEGDD
jgi:hypothetical protein